MHLQERGRSLRNTAMLLDLFHIVVGILIVALAVISFLNPEDHMLMFPAIFLLAAVLNLVNGFFKIRLSGREKKKKISGVTALLFGLLLGVLAGISAVSIWWG